MDIPEVVDVSEYAKRFELKTNIVGIQTISRPPIDINQPGLIMHGSEADPYTILKYGLVPQRTKQNDMEPDWQVCLGLNSKNPNLTLEKNMSRKNPAVKYAGNFSHRGVVYVIGKEVKDTPSYREFWDPGEDARGYAWVKHAIKADTIRALITGNIPLAAAATVATESKTPIYKPDGTCYKAETL
jgi:hypothetical protein